MELTAHPYGQSEAATKVYVPSGFQKTLVSSVVVATVSSVVVAAVSSVVVAAVSSVVVAAKMVTVSHLYYYSAQ